MTPARHERLNDLPRYGLIRTLYPHVENCKKKPEG